MTTKRIPNPLQDEAAKWLAPRRAAVQYWLDNRLSLDMPFFEIKWFREEESMDWLNPIKEIPYVIPIHFHKTKILQLKPPERIHHGDGAWAYDEVTYFYHYVVADQFGNALMSEEKQLYHNFSICHCKESQQTAIPSTST